MPLGTECAQCSAAMPMLAQAAESPFRGAKMTITGYLCPECGHWNDLKRRKWWREANR